MQKKKTLAPALSLKVIEESILPMMDKLVSDDIPNIRFNVAKSYGVLIDVLKRVPVPGTIASAEKAGANKKAMKGSQRGMELIQESIMPNLEKLQQDDDQDVRYFASTAAQVLGDATGSATGSGSGSGSGSGA